MLWYRYIDDGWFMSEVYRIFDGELENEDQSRIFADTHSEAAAREIVDSVNNLRQVKGD